MRFPTIATLVLAFLALDLDAQAPRSPKEIAETPRGVGAPGDSHAPRKSRWTVLLYYCADCNLENDIVRDVNTVESAAPGGDVEIICLIDRAKGFTAVDGDWTTARTYRILRGTDDEKFESQLLHDSGELDLGHPDTLERFVGSAIAAFPAEHYALFLAGHGGGWKTCIPDDDTAGLRARKDMFAFEVRDGIDHALKRTGVRKLDILAFDCCIMAQLEALWICRDVADYIVASEAISFGSPMKDCTASFGDAALGPRQVCEKLVVDFGRSYTRNGKETGTLSAVDSRHLDEVVRRLQELAVKLYPALDEHWAAVARGHFFAETYHGRVDYQRGRGATASYDLLDMLGRIRKRMGAAFPAEEEYQAIVAAVERAVIATWSGTRRPGSHGISIYAPIRWECMRPDYRENAGVADWAWPVLLEHLHEMQQVHGRRPGIVQSAVFDGDGRESKVVRPFDGATCRFVLKGENILWLLMDYAIRGSDGSVAILYKTFHVAPSIGHERPSEDFDLMIPDYPDGRSVQAQELGGLMFGIRSGDKLIPTTVAVTDPGDFENALVQGLISHPNIGTSVPVEISFSTLTWSARSVRIVEEDEDGDRSVRELEKVPEDARITLLLETDSPREGRVTIRSGDVTWGGGPKLAMTAAPEGEQTLFIRAESLAGQSNHHAVSYTLAHDEKLRRALALRGAIDHARAEGRWRLQRWSDDTSAFQDLDVTITMTPKEKSEEKVLSYAVGVTAFEGLATLDVDGIPLLSLYRKDAGAWRRFESWVVLDVAADSMVLHDITESRPDVSRRMRLLRIGGAPAGPLEGRWRTAEGLTLAVQGNRYERSGDGRPPSTGSLEIRGAELVIRPDSGPAASFGFAIEGDRLTLSLGGSSTTFVKQTGDREDGR